MANKSRLESTRDTNAEKTVAGVAGAIGFKPEVISVTGTERKRIYAYGVKNKTDKDENEKIRKAFSKACKTEYATPVFSDDFSGCMIFNPENTLTANTFCLKSTKEGESCSGDSAVSFETTDRYFYALISDGMGSGEDARRASKTALSMLEKLLRCKIKKSTATELVGDILKRRNEECFATVDIMELDLVSGNSSFLKSGAAASYIVRNGGVYCIDACSMPVGIASEAHPEEINFKIQEGDTVVMISDGIVADNVDGKWIADIVCSGFSSNEELAKIIMKNAMERNRQSDDKTVLVINVEKKESEQSAKEA